MNATECYITHQNLFIYRTPNQRLIHIHLICDNNHASINYQAHITARATLSKNAFQLYDYLQFHHHDSIIALSSADVYKTTKLKEQSYAKAFNELIEKGYLVANNITKTKPSCSKDAYHFFEGASMLSDNKPTKKHKPSKTTPAVPSTRCCLPDEIF